MIFNCETPLPQPWWGPLIAHWSDAQLRQKEGGNGKAGGGNSGTSRVSRSEAVRRKSSTTAACDMTWARSALDFSTSTSFTRRSSATR